MLLERKIEYKNVKKGEIKDRTVSDKVREKAFNIAKNSL